jgi:AraC family ethanolamine operon transcriptional activator
MGETFPAGAKVDFCADSYEMAEEAALKWNVETVQLEKGTYHCSIAGVHTDKLQLGRSWRSLGTRLGGQIPQGTVVLAFSLNAGARIQYRGRQVSSEELIVQEDTRGLDLSFMGALDIVTVAVTRDELNRRAYTLWGKPFPVDTRTGVIRFAEKAGTLELKRSIADCLSETFKTPEILAGELPALQLENQVLDTLFSNLEDHAKAQGTVDRHRAARRAADFIHAHCSEEVSISGLCEATGTNRRTLHLGFMELYGIPPMKYLQALRLCKVRHHLLRSQDPNLKVTDIATSWGFNHLGRFAGAYRAFFGELPSVEKTSHRAG